MSTQHHPLDADVIIIGAGIAGLTAAYTLITRERSLSIIVLEATDRIGGRIVSKSLKVCQNENVTFDIGGQWISSQQKSIINLLRNLQLPIQTRSYAGRIIIDYGGKIQRRKSHCLSTTGTIPSKLELAKFVEDIEYLCDHLPLKKELSNKTMRDFINENIFHKRNKILLESQILINCGISAENITVGFYLFLYISRLGFSNFLNFDQEMRDLYIQGGAERICEKIAILLADEIEILKNVKVFKIISHKHDVEIGSSSGTYFCKNLILAISPVCIQDIMFFPPLPNYKLNPLRNSQTGKLCCFIATYETAFWRDVNYSATAYIFRQNINLNPVIFCFDNSVDDNAGLSGYLVVTKNDMKDLILQQLAAYFGKEALSPLDFVIESWESGSPMCCYKSFEDVQNLGKPLNRIFWAGAEASTKWYGTMAGAVLSGERVAAEVLYDLRPALLTVEDMTLLRRTNLSFIRRCNRNEDSIYNKFYHPFYQVSAGLIILLSIIIWRKCHLTFHLKKLIKKIMTIYQIV